MAKFLVLRKLQVNPLCKLNKTGNLRPGIKPRAGGYPPSVGGGVFHLNVDGKRITEFISVPETGGYQTWQTLSIPDVRLPRGQHTLQMVMDSGGYYNAVGNFNWFSLN